MKILTEFECDLIELKSFANSIATKSKIGDIYLLKGDLGVGKTTFSRFLINALFKKFQLNKPINIKSPSYPILINYPLLNFEIYHYDLYRLKNKNELGEIEFFDNLENNISLVEWPEIIINELNIYNHYIIDFMFISINKRKIKYQYSCSNE